ncbi:MAG: hypothetical protein E7392_01770 [Ruminococcaceae bacterium]|nr:hypothetical protein [Oscillospiraceae bacterium]
MTISTTPDLIIGYVGDRYVNAQTFNDNKSTIELLLKDVNGDKKMTASLLPYTADLQSDIDTLLVEMLDAGSYDIYIASEETFENCEDKSLFANAEEYITFGSSEIKTLKDKTGRIYAISIDGNEFVKRMGILDSTDLYIAVALDKDKKEMSENRKNGRNITGYIIDNK